MTYSPNTAAFSQGMQAGTGTVTGGAEARRNVAEAKYRTAEMNRNLLPPTGGATTYQMQPSPEQGVAPQEAGMSNEQLLSILMRKYGAPAPGNPSGSTYLGQTSLDLGGQQMFNRLSQMQ